VKRAFDKLTKIYCLERQRSRPREHDECAGVCLVLVLELPLRLPVGLDDGQRVLLLLTQLLEPLPHFLHVACNSAQPDRPHRLTVYVLHDHKIAHMKRRREEIDLRSMRAMIDRGKRALRPACLPDNSVVDGLVTNVNMVFDMLEYKMFTSKAGSDERVACARELEPELPDGVTDVYYDHKTGSAVISTGRSLKEMQAVVWRNDDVDAVERCIAKVNAEGHRVDNVFHAPVAVVDDGYYKCLFS
jgi:hypothetical protein